MKKLIYGSLFTLVFALGAGAQGVVAFANVGGGLNAPIYLNTVGGTLLPTTGFTVELLVGTTSGNVTTSVGTKSLASAGYVTATSGTALPGGFPSGTPYFFKLRAFDGGSFASATQRGESPVFSFTAASGSGSPPPLPGFFTAANDPASLGGLQSFAVTVVPEPSTIALGLIGGAALLLRRRRQS
jgi:hypothetical protein